jgi:hypothetical protein
LKSINRKGRNPDISGFRKDRKEFMYCMLALRPSQQLCVPRPTGVSRAGFTVKFDFLYSPIKQLEYEKENEFRAIPVFLQDWRTAIVFRAF